MVLLPTRSEIDDAGAMEWDGIIVRQMVDFSNVNKKDLSCLNTTYSSSVLLLHQCRDVVKF